MLNELKRKISNLCDVPVAAVVNAADARNLYEVPLVMHAEGLDDFICNLFGFTGLSIDLSEWEALVERVEDATRPVRVGIIGKYVSLIDAYLSVVESLKHGGFFHGADVEIVWIQAEDVEGMLAAGRLRDLDGHRHPWRFRRARRRGQDRCGQLRPREQHPVPRTVSRDAGHDHRVRPQCPWSLRRHIRAEFDPRTPHPVIDLMETQRDVTEMGGTMRLGAYVAKLEAGSPGGACLRQRGRLRTASSPL